MSPPSVFKKPYICFTMATQKELHNIADGGMDLDSAPHYVKSPDYQEAYNLVTEGNESKENGYGTNFPSTEDITSTRPAGINKGVALKGFDSVRKVYSIVYNSQQFHQILETDVDTNTETVIFTNKTDSGGQDILSVSPSFKIDDISLVNDEFLTWTDTNAQIYFISLKRLKSGSFGVLTKEDFLLIKPQPLKPLTAVYNDDATRGANLLNTKLFQFTAQWISPDYTYSAFATHSKRPVPVSESTSAVGTDVAKNNNIIVGVDIGNNRVKTVLIAGRYADLDFFEIKRVDRSYITALTNTAVDVFNKVFEAYDPATNIYSFAFYNDGLYQPIAALQTDLPYDYVPLRAGSLEVVNGNIIALGDITEGYPLPTTKIQVSASAYSPNFQLPETAANPLRVVYTQNSNYVFPKKFKITVKFDGLPKAGDILNIVLHDTQYFPAKQTYSFTVPSGLQNNLAGVIQAWVTQIPNSNYYVDDNSGIGLQITATDWYELESATVQNANEGSGISKSIAAIKTNSSNQLALRYRDKYGRFFPLLTGNEYVIKTLSYSQVKGLTAQINWSINTPSAPADAVDYQWMISYNTTHQNTLYTLASLISYKGTWNAKENKDPALLIGSGKVGDARQVIVSGTTNVGNGDVAFDVGDYAVYNGQTWDRLPKTFGDLTNTSDYLVLNLQSLAKFNKKNSSSILAYDYSAGDRVTFCYYMDGMNVNYFNSASIDVEVIGYDPTSYLLKIRKSPALDLSVLSGKNLLIEIYTPKKTQVSGDTTVEASTNVFYEIGERFTITNGLHDVLSGVITDGDVYYKTRQMVGAIDPNVLYPLLVESPHFSDYYISNFYSYGRPGNEADTPLITQKKASIRYSDIYILGSKINGLTRFFGERIYGEGDGESSSSYGAIKKLYQRGNTLICIQENETGYIPVYGTIVEDQSTQQQYALSDKLFNKIRYSGLKIGMGDKGKSTFATKDGTVYFVDTNRCEPFKATTGGIVPISKKLSKFFKEQIKNAVKNKLTIIGFFDDFRNIYVVSIATAGDVVDLFEFDDLQWGYLEPYTVLPAGITITTAPTNGVATYNSTTGQALYTPNNGFVGNDSFIISFTVNGTTVTKKVCVSVSAGNVIINQFYFADVMNVTLSTQYTSNAVAVSGNNVPVPVSVVNGEYSVNGGAWGTAPGYVSPNDTVRVRQTSSDSTNVTVSVTLTIGDKSDSFDIKTQPDGIGNTVQSQDFTRDDDTCPSGQSGQVYTYTVPANTYFAPTLSEANDLALADITANGQNEANIYGTCGIGDSVRIPVRLATDAGLICGATPMLVFYSNTYSSLTTGVTIYTNSGLTVPVSGFLYVLDDSYFGVTKPIYNLDDVGQVLTPTGNSC